MARPKHEVINVPLGGGIDHSNNSRSVVPPNCLRAVNIKLTEGGAYMKRDGFTTVASLSGGSTSILVSGPDDTVAAFDADGARILTDGSFVRQDFGGLIPTEVTRHPIKAFRGATSNANCALSHDGDYLGIILTEADPHEGMDAVLMIVSVADFQVVWGPYRLPELAYMPRVEPVTDSGFMFFGTTNPDWLTAECELSKAFGEPGGSAPSAVLIENNVAVISNDGGIQTVYDTAPTDATAEAVFVVYSTGGSPIAQLVSPTGLGTPSTVDNADVAAQLGSISIRYHVASDTVLVAFPRLASTEFHVLYSDSTMATWTTAGGAGVSYALLGTYPVLSDFNDSPFVLALNDRVISITGEGPGTPSISSSNGNTPTLHRRPVTRGIGVGGQWHFQRYVRQNADRWGDHLIQGSEVVLLEEPKTLSGGGVTEERAVVHVGETRTPLWAMDHYHQYSVLITASERKIILGTIPQAATNGTTRIYIPQLIANAAYLPSPIQTEDRPNADGEDSGGTDRSNWGADPIATTDVLTQREGPISLNEDTLQLVIAEVAFHTTTYSSLDYYRSVLVAAGDLYVWDGNKTFPSWLPKPLDTSLDPNEGTGGNAAEGASLQLANGQSMGFRGVLYFLDRNGIKYRSEPFDLGEITNDSGTPQFYAPEWSLILHPSLKSVLLSDLQLSCEVYATRSYATGSPTTQFNIAWRGGIIPASGAGGLTYTLDATDFFAVENVTTTPTFDGSGLHNPTPLYTESGELPPEPVPASNVMVHAGNYLFLLSSEDPYIIHHTKPLDIRIGPEFNPVLTIQAPPDCGGVVSLGGESDRLLLLCANGVWELFVGSGPDANNNGSFGPFRKLVGGAGCLTHRTTVSGPFGTFFVSESGPKVIAPGGELVDVGKPILPLLDLTAMQCAVYHRRAQEIWLFATDERQGDERTYIFDVTKAAWTTSTMVADCAVSAGKEFLRVRSDTVMRSDPDTFEDGIVVYPFILRTAWVPIPASTQTLRVRRIGILQDYREGNVNTEVTTYVDYDPETIVDTFTYGSFSGPEALRVSRQKISAIQIEFEEAALLFSSNNAGISGLWLEVYSKGMVRSRRVGGTGGGFQAP